MKKNFRFLAMAVVAMAAAVFTGCSSDDDFLAPYEESAIQTRAISSTNALIDFDKMCIRDRRKGIRKTSLIRCSRRSVRRRSMTASNTSGCASSVSVRSAKRGCSRV